MKQLAKYYQIDNDIKFSNFIDLKFVLKEGFNNAFDIIKQDKKKLVQIIAYCFMPTHIHLIRFNLGIPILPNQPLHPNKCTIVIKCLIIIRFSMLEKILRW